MALRTLLAGQIIVLLVFWQFAMPPAIPTVSEVLTTLGELWGQGLGSQIFVSLTLYVQALFIATIFSLLLSFSASLAFFRPMAIGWAKLRFLGFVGVPFFATYFLSGVHEIKLALLSFSISVFMVTGMLDVLASIPKEKYDLARTLRQALYRLQS